MNERTYLAAVIASGLLATHGVDAGGVPAAAVATKAFEIVDALHAAEAAREKAEAEAAREKAEAEAAQQSPTQLHPPAAPAAAKQG